MATLQTTQARISRRALIKGGLAVGTGLVVGFRLPVTGRGTALAQATGNPSPEEEATCPPDIKGEPPTVGSGSSAPLSDKLARSKGVICPPAGIDRDMQVTPPSGGHLKIIPPPGTPGGDPNVQPK